MSKTSTPNDPKVVKALKLIEGGKSNVREAVRKTGANRSTVRHHLRARGWKASAAALKPKAKKSKAKKATVVPANVIQHHLIASADGQKSLTVFIPGESPVIVAGDHPQFDAILAEAGAATPNVEHLRELADTTVLVSTKFEKLTERISTRNGRLYFDGDELDTSLTAKILSMLDEGSENWKGLVNFLEKLYQNPNTNARDAFYGWLQARPFDITEDGDVIGYKRVEGYEPVEGERAGTDPIFQSWNNGPAIVNGEEYDGSGNGVPQSVGDVVEKPRSSVDNSTSNECSDGLHVGTLSFAESNHTYGQTVLRVLVNPRDVVGVPTDVHGSTKFRCCRYYIEAVK